MASTTRLYTVEDVRAMPDDGNRYEVIDGELLVSPAPGYRHQAALRELALLLAGHVKQHRLGVLLFAPFDIVLGPLTMVEPDILFVRESRRDRFTPRELTEAPDLAVEVLSRSTAHVDRGRKLALYRTCGVGEYWIVDLDRRQVEVWRRDAREASIHRDQLSWQPEPAVPPLLIQLAEIFDTR